MKRIEEERLVMLAKEALYMHQVWEGRYLVLMMSCVDSDERIERLIDKAEESATYWLEKYNRIMTKLGAN